MNLFVSKGLPVVSTLKCGIFPNILNNNVLFLGAIGCSKMFNTSSVCQAIFKKNSPAAVARRKALDNVDWLPFGWTRPRNHDPFEDSGDLVKELEHDPSWPKPDFEFSEELKSASEDVKQYFTLITGSKAEIKEAVKRDMLRRVQRHPNDFDSLEVKIALGTVAIRSLFEHQRARRWEIRGGRYILDILIKKRNKMLKSLRMIDEERFNWLCKELKLYYKPQKQGGIREFWCRKWDLRRLTKEYCTKMIKDKKAAYHEELKLQQSDFLKEKEETLAWIEKEEKELAILTEELQKDEKKFAYVAVYDR